MQYVDRPMIKGTLLDLVLENVTGQVEGGTVQEHLGDSEPNFEYFNVLMEKDEDGLQIKALIGGRPISLT